MRFDLVVAGVGGQGVLSAAGIMAEAARREGLTVKQTEVHGMAQRGGAVHATIRLADGPIASELVGIGTAHLILGMEPVEALRHLGWLAPDGVLLTATDPVEVPGYPPLGDVHRQVTALGGRLIEARRIAREAGSPRSPNVVMVGAASPLLPVAVDTLEACITDLFGRRGERAAAGNLAAFRAGRAAA